MAKKIVSYRTEENYTEDYRCGGWVTDYRKVYVCGKCKKLVEKNVFYCSHCGEKLDGFVDNISKNLKSELRKLKTQRTKLIKTVTPENFEEIVRKSKDLDKEIEYTNEKIYDWEKFTYGSKPRCLE